MAGLENVIFLLHLDNTESKQDSNTDDLGHFLLVVPPSSTKTKATKPSAKKRKRAKPNPKPVRVNTTRKRCKECIPLYEDRLSALCEETLKLEKEIQLKHSNLAGRHGKKFDVKVLAFSQEKEKSSTAAKVKVMEADYLSKRKYRTQKQASYEEFLRASYLPLREEFLNILKTEINELDRELEVN